MTSPARPSVARRLPALRRACLGAAAALVVCAAGILPALPGTVLSPVLLAAGLQGPAEPAGAPPAPPPVAAADHGTPAGPSAARTAAPREERHEEAAHEESIWAVVARLFNFAILAGTLVYLLRSPFAAYLKQRGTAIRSNLAQAAETRRQATAELEAIDAKLEALPGEIETLKRRGAEEIAAEEVRMREAAEAERRRTLEQARREMDTKVQGAERALRARAAELAVAAATERVTRTITEDDQARLVDRYLAQVRS